PVALLAEALDLDELPSGVPAGGLEGIRPAAHDDVRLRRRRAVDRGARPLRGARRLAALARQDAGESEVCAVERPEAPDLQRRRRLPDRLDQLLRALVPLPAPPDAAVHALLQVIRAAEPAHLAGPDPRPRGALDEHSDELPDLIDVVARLPLWRRRVADLA